MICGNFFFETNMSSAFIINLDNDEVRFYLEVQLPNNVGDSLLIWFEHDSII